MPISDRTRKILWAKSGNLCAICRHVLVLEETSLDIESVVGDECHITSGATNGPRHDQELPAEKVDELANLMLLCRVHHKMIDDQPETYTVEILRSIKQNHEKWVVARLKEKPHIKPIRVVRISNEIPTQLPLIGSGNELLNLAVACHAAYHSYSEGLDEKETELVGSFIQLVKDWADLADSMEPIEQIRAAKSIDDELKELNARGFLVFAARERQRMEGGVNPPSSFYVLHFAVRHMDDPLVINGHV